MPGVKKAHFVIFATNRKALSFFRFISDAEAITFDPDYMLNPILCQHHRPKLKNYWN